MKMILYCKIKVILINKHKDILDTTRRIQSKFIIKNNHRKVKLACRKDYYTTKGMMKEFHVFIPPPRENGPSPDKLSTNHDER